MKDTSFTQITNGALFNKQTFNLGGQKFTHRHERWGTVIYDFQNDLFSALVNDQNESIVPAAPLGLYWLVTAPCNLRCIHCYGNVEELPRTAPDSVEQKSIADRIIESGAMRVTLNGGEPLLRKDTPEIIERLADSDVSVILGTNGTYLTPDILSSVRRTTRVEISFDSHIELVNNSIRISRAKTGNAYAESLAAIDLCLGNDINLRVLTCLNLRNYKHIEAMGDLLYARGVRDWSVSWTLHAGRARHIYGSLVSPEMFEYEEALGRVRRKYPEMKIKTSNRSNAVEGNNRFSCLVFPDGRMFAEDLEKGEKVGFHSLLEAPLAESWNDENYNRRQHFRRWTGERVSQSKSLTEVSAC